jgi:splicing factor 3A subunit 3
MRCLGIPNTKHFVNIIKIDDANHLWAKMQSNKGSEVFDQDNEEEYEDSMGNVVSKKVYLDLQRQGLL